MFVRALPVCMFQGRGLGRCRGEVGLVKCCSSSHSLGWRIVRFERFDHLFFPKLTLLDTSFARMAQIGVAGWRQNVGVGDGSQSPP